ncbi:MAG: hypothetical protein ACLU84_04670 [Clostridia bacterium]
MSFSTMLEILQERNAEKIVLIKLGAFYIATGRDAILLHTKLGLKCTCFKENICKVGIPVKSIEKYIEKLEKIKYAYIVYAYDKENRQLEKKYYAEGRKNKIINRNCNCLDCKGMENYKDDPYMLAITKLLKDEENKK